jgi:hypothetical protein
VPPSLEILQIAHAGFEVKWKSAGCELADPELKSGADPPLNYVYPH